MFKESVNNITPTEQVKWIADIINKYPVKKILAEKNSIGSVYIDMLRKQIKVPVTEFVTINKSKQDLVESLQMHLENGLIRILPDARQLDELRKYQAEINLKSKTVSYNAATGNDDDVIALMLALRAVNSNLGTYRIS